MKINSVPKCDTCAAWAWHGIRVKPGWAQLVWMSYLSLCFVRKLTSCEFAAEPSIWPQLSGDDSLAERELAGAAALLWRQMLRAFPRLSGDHHCFLWAPLCLVVWSVPLITACLPAFYPQAAKALIKFESPSHQSLALQLNTLCDRILAVTLSAGTRWFVAPVCWRDIKALACLIGVIPSLALFCCPFIFKALCTYCKVSLFECFL